MADGIQIPITSTYSGQGVQQATADLSRLNSVSSQALASHNAHLASYRNSATEIANMNRQFNAQTSAVARTTSGIASLSAGWQFLTGTILAAGTVRVARQTYELARMGAEADFTSAKFNRLSMSIGTTGDAFLNELRTATRGTVSDFGLMKQGADLVQLGLANTGTEAIRLSRVMTALGMDTGELTLALANQSKRRLDQLGLSLSAFNVIESKLRESGMSKEDAFKEAFMQTAEQTVNLTGNMADTQLGDVMRMEASMQNAKMAAAGFLSNWLFPENRAGRGTFSDIRAINAMQMRGTADYNMLNRAPLGFGGLPTFGGGASAPGNDDARQSSYEAMARHYMQGGTGIMPEGATLDYKTLIDNALKITSQTEKFTQATADLNEALADENQKLDDMEKKYGKNSSRLDEQREKISDIQEQIRGVGESAVNMGDAMLLANLQATEGTEELQLSYALASGEITQKSYDQQMAIMKISDAMQDGKISADQAHAAVSRVMSADGFEGKMTMDIYINYIVSGAGRGTATGTNTVSTMVGDSLVIQGGAGGAQNETRRAKGGPLGKNVTMVGEEGWEYIVKNGDEYVVVPHEAAVWMQNAGIMPSQGRAGGGTIGGRNLSQGRSTGTRGGRSTGGGSSLTSRGTFTASSGGGILSDSDITAIIEETAADISGSVSATVAGAVTSAVANSPQIAAMAQSVAVFEQINETLELILAKTATESGIGRAVNSDLARVA